MTRKINRRTFIASGAAVAASAVLAGCQPRRWVVREPYLRAPEDQTTGVATWYASACGQCPVGCGIIVRVMNGRARKIEGNPEHPLNQGKLCARGQAGLQVLYNPDRLRGPLQQQERGSGSYQNLGWDAALMTLSRRMQEAAGGLAIWTGTNIPGHLYDLLQRLATAVGAPAPVVYDLYGMHTGYPVLSAAAQAASGRAGLPAPDISTADVIFSFGSDFLVSGLSPVRYGIDYGRFRSQPFGKRGYLVQFEPRMSNTGAKADDWLAIRPGSEGLVAQAVARIIADQRFGAADRQERARAVAGNVDVAAAAQASDIPVEDLTELARVFAEAERPVVMGASGALTGYDNGLAAATAVAALNAVAGTAPSADGATAALPEGAPGSPAMSPYRDVQALLDRMRAGQVQTLLIAGANPVYDLPTKAGLVDALAGVPFTACITPVTNETTAQANLILPDRTYLESWGFVAGTPNFGTPFISARQPVVQPMYDVRAAGDVLLAVAKNIPAAAQAMNWQDEVAFLRSLVGELPAGAFGGSGTDVLWARFLQHGGWWPSQDGDTGETRGGAAPGAGSTPAQPAAQTGSGPSVAPSAFPGDANQYPYYLYLYPPALLSTGSGANLPWLQGSPDPMTSIQWQSWVEIHPATMQRLGVLQGDVVRITTPDGEIEAAVYPYPVIRTDTIAIPLGQGRQNAGRYASGRGVNPLQLLGAQAGTGGDNLAWSAVRAQVARTGQRVRMATFEWTPGVLGDFDNLEKPG